MYVGFVRSHLTPWVQLKPSTEGANNKQLNGVQAIETRKQTFGMRSINERTWLRPKQWKRFSGVLNKKNAEHVMEDLTVLVGIINKFFPPLTADSADKDNFVDRILNADPQMSDNLLAEVQNTSWSAPLQSLEEIKNWIDNNSALVSNNAINGRPKASKQRSKNADTDIDEGDREHAHSMNSNCSNKYVARGQLRRSARLANKRTQHHLGTNTNTNLAHKKASQNNQKTNAITNPSISHHIPFFTNDDLLQLCMGKYSYNLSFHYVTCRFSKIKFYYNLDIPNVIKISTIKSRFKSAKSREILIKFGENGLNDIKWHGSCKSGKRSSNPCVHIASALRFIICLREGIVDFASLKCDLHKRLQQSIFDCEKYIQWFEQNARYCVCQQAYDEQMFMIQCDLCRNWYHPSCITNNEEQQNRMQNITEDDDWRCPFCCEDIDLDEIERLHSVFAIDTNTEIGNKIVSNDINCNIINNNIYCTNPNCDRNNCNCFHNDDISIVTNNNNMIELNENSEECFDSDDDVLDSELDQIVMQIQNNNCRTNSNMNSSVCDGCVSTGTPPARKKRRLNQNSTVTNDMECCNDDNNRQLRRSIRLKQKK